MTRMNDFGQPIGDPADDWSGAKWPERVSLEGALLCGCSVEGHFARGAAF